VWLLASSKGLVTVMQLFPNHEGRRFVIIAKLKNALRIFETTP
jgi:hypothetical protein